MKGIVLAVPFFLIPIHYCEEYEKWNTKWASGRGSFFWKLACMDCASRGKIVTSLG